MNELVWVSIINILAKGLKFAFEIGTNYFVDKETYGYFAILLSYLLIYSRVITLGIPNVMLREFPKNKNMYYHAFLLFNSVMIMLVGIIASYLIVIWLKLPYLSLFSEVPIIVLATSLLVLYSSYLRSFGYIKLWIFFQDIAWYLFYFTGLSFLYLFHFKDIDISVILELYTYSIVMTLVILLLFIRFKQKLFLFSKISIKKIKYIFSHSLPVLFTGLTYLILARIDVIMLGSHVDIKLVGEYNIVARITIQVLFFQQVVTAYFYPRLAKKFAQNKNYLNISQFITKYVIVSFISVSVLSIFLFVWIRQYGLFELLNIVNKEELFMVFIIFSITQIIYSLIFFYGYILLYIHKQKVEYFNNLFILIIGILLNYILIPSYGTAGAAIATAIAIVLGSIFEMAEVKYFTNTFFLSFRRSHKDV